MCKRCSKNDFIAKCLNTFVTHCSSLFCCHHGPLHRDNTFLACLIQFFILIFLDPCILLFADVNIALSSMVKDSHEGQNLTMTAQDA